MKNFMYVAFEVHICYWHIYGNSMVIKNFIFLFLWTYMCSTVDLYVDNNSSGVGHICSTWPENLFRGHLPVL